MAWIHGSINHLASIISLSVLSVQSLQSLYVYKKKSNQISLKLLYILC